MSDVLTALDADTGAVAWTQPDVKGRENSAVAWRPAGATGAGGAAYLLCNSKPRGEVACVGLADGKVRWTVPGGGPSTVAVAGDRMVVLPEKPDIGLLAYRITPDRAEKAWAVPRLADRGASPIIHGGHVYVVAGDRTVCVEVETGELAWEGRPGKGDISSPVLAGGKLIVPLTGGRVAMVPARPDAFTLAARARVPLAPCTSPAVAGGKLYVRTNDGAACFDLTTGGAGSD
jgi:outer membrane protein assembly factor BamB